MSRSQEVDFVYFIFLSYFSFDLLFIFLFLEQLGLGSEVIGHETWEDEVEGSRTNDIIQHEYHMLTSCSTHGHLG